MLEVLFRRYGGEQEVICRRERGSPEAEMLRKQVAQMRREAKEEGYECLYSIRYRKEGEGDV